MKHLEQAKEFLNRAIKRHERHMNGTEATDEASQQKMMDDMKAAYAALDSSSDDKKMGMTHIMGPARFLRS